MQFIKVPIDRIGKPTSIELRNSRKTYIAPLDRCIVDAVVDYKRYNTLPKAYVWIRERVNQKYFLEEVINTVKKYGNISAKRRIGFFIFSQTKNEKLVAPILNVLKPKKGWIPLDPYSDAKGTTNKQWRIIDNVNFKKSRDAQKP